MPTLESLEEQIGELKEQNKVFARALIDLNKRLDSRDWQTVAKESYPVLEEDSEPVVSESISDAPLPKVVEAVEDKKEKGFEEKIGVSLFSRLGILALVIGIGFFIKYVSDNNLIGHGARILIGVAAGIGLVLGGKFSATKEKYANWGKVLIGGGLAIMYFSVYAAYAFLDYRNAIGISQGVDIALLVLVAALAVFLSIKDNSKLIAAEAFLLGFLTCLLNRDYGTMVLVYNLILTVALVFVSAYKKWPVLGIGGVVATYASYSLWRMENSSSNIMAMSFLAIFFLSYVLQSIVFSAKAANDKEIEQKIVVANVLNSLFFFICGLAVSRDWRGDYDALFCALFATFHLVSYWAAFSLGKKLTAWVYFYSGICALAIAVPLWLDDEMITIAWSALSLVLLLTALKASLPHFRYAAHGLFALTIIKVLFADSSLDHFSSENIFESTRMMAFVAAAAFSAAAYFFLSFWRGKDDDKIADATLYFYGAVPTFFLAMLTMLEVSYINDWNWFNVWIGLLFIPVCFLPFFSMFKEMRFQAPVLGFLLVMKIFAYDFFHSMNEAAIDNDRLMSCLWVFLLLAGAGFFWKYFRPRLSEDVKAAPSIYGWLAVVTIFLSIAMELSGYSISVGWAILAIILISLGFIFRSKNFRYQGIAILAMTLLKVFLYDTSELETPYRMISYISLGVILLGSSFLYNKYKDKIDR
jgi:uncharacterized membrane protein